MLIRSAVIHHWLSYALSQYMMPIYQIARIKLSFVQSSILCYEFSYFLKNRMYEHLFIITLGETMKVVTIES